MSTLNVEKVIHEIYSVNKLTHGTNLPMIPREQLRGIVERNALECLGIPVPETADSQAHVSESGKPDRHAQVTISAQPISVTESVG